MRLRGLSVFQCLLWFLTHTPRDLIFIVGGLWLNLFLDILRLLCPRSLSQCVCYWYITANFCKLRILIRMLRSRDNKYWQECGGKESPHSLRVDMPPGAATVEISVENSHKAKRRSTTWPGSTALDLCLLFHLWIWASDGMKWFVVIAETKYVKRDRGGGEARTPERGIVGHGYYEEKN